jgi:hypothetical protein
LIICYQDYNNRLHAKQRSAIDAGEIAYILPQGNEHSSLLQAVCLFNNLNSIVHIYCSQQLIDSMQAYSNEHLKYHNINDENVVIEGNIIVTYGLGALHFIKQHIPVVIMGPMGLGGWIEPENFTFLSDNGFMGRPGGTLWEPAPLPVFLEELYAVQNAKHLHRLLHATSELAHTLPYRPFSELEAIKKALKEKAEQLYDPAKKWDLCPALASNMYFVTENNTVYLRRKRMNDTVLSVSATDFVFLKQIDGTKNMHALHELSGMNESDFWEVIIDLVQLKAIVY